MLVFDDVSFGYPNQSIFENLSLFIKKGEIVSILGPSGSGKTTLFKLISRLDHPCHGEIYFEDSGRSSLMLSYMMQEDLLLEYKTVISNLMMVFKIKHPFNLKGIKSYFIKKKNFREKAINLLHEMGLYDVENLLPKRLSKGMRQRVSLARALLFERPFLLLDEPFSAVDPIKRESLFQIILQMKKKYNLTILQITHDIHDAKSISDKIYYLENRNLRLMVPE